MQNNAQKILAIVPAYNEAGGVASVIRELRALRFRLDVLVIDDGSTDRTAEIAGAEDCVLITLPFNLGIGGAVQTGFKYAARHGYDVAVQVDGDGQHIPSEMETLLGTMREKRADMVIGTRFIESKGYTTSAMRRLGVGVFSAVNSHILRQKITDNTSGFRAYNREAIAFLAKHYPHDYPEPESVILMGRNGFCLAEVPVRMRDRAHGQSSISAFRSVYYMFKVLLAIFVDLFKERLRSEEASC